MCKKTILVILLVIIFLTIASGCISFKFETHTGTDNNFEIKFETPIGKTQAPTFTPQPLVIEKTSSSTIIPTLTATVTAIRPLSTPPVLTQVINTIQVTVKANQSWQDTGIIVSSTDTVSVQYISGQWGVNDPQERYMNASGISRTRPDAILPSSNLGALIGKIGSGTPFIIGAERVFVPPENGHLYLQINDAICGNCNGPFDDNEGQIIVKITVSSETNTHQSAQVSPKDEMIMIYIPSGNFKMGSYNDWPEQAPVHDVNLASFWIDQTEVANVQYALCVEARACRSPTSNSSNTHDTYYGNPEFDQYPVVFVNWYDALNYCKWAGRRLPSEAEWEKAARGTDERTYPWGNNLPNDQLANFNNNIFDTTKVGEFPAGASPYGVLDMAGNAEEWVADWYGAMYYSNSPEKNPPGPSIGTAKMLRGGSWFYGEFYLRTAYRNSFGPNDSNNSVGFRCALSESP